MDPSASGESDGQLLKAIARLPEEVREVVEPIVMERRSVEEVAETLGLDTDDVERRMSEGWSILADEVGVDELRKWLR